MIVTNDFLLVNQIQPLNIAGGGGYSFCIRPGKSSLSGQNPANFGYPSKQNVANPSFKYDLNQLAPADGGAGTGDAAILNGNVPQDGSIQTFSASGGYNEASYPWRWGSFPLKVTATGYDSKISTFFISGPEAYYVENGFTMLKIEGLTAEATGYFTCTVGTDPGDRIIANREQYRVTQLNLITTGWTYNSATANNPINFGGGLAAGFPLKNAVAWRASIVASKGTPGTTLTGGQLIAWYQPTKNDAAASAFQFQTGWSKGDFSFPVQTGVYRYVTPDNPVAVPNGWLWIEPNLVTTGAAQTDYVLVVEITYASQP